MALPAGITTATVLFGKDFDVLGGGNDVTLRITPSHTLIWEATGDRLTAFDVAVSAESDTVGTFELPHTDQAGFINEAGAEITDWWYTIVGTVRAGRAQKTYTKRVQVTSDVTSFDLDTLPVNASVGPVGSVPLPTLTSVNGQTGAVVLTASAIGAIPNTSEGRQALAESTELLDTIAASVESVSGVYDMAAMGDSITAANQTDPVEGRAISWASLISEWAGIRVFNPSVPGERQGDIATRYGNPIEFTVPGGVIPAGTDEFTVTLVAPTATNFIGSASNGPQSAFTGTFLGVPVSVRFDATAWRMRRLSAATASKPVPTTGGIFRVSAGRGVQSAVLVSFGGRNGSSASLVARTRDMLNRMPSPRRALLVPPIFSTAVPANEDGLTSLAGEYTEPGDDVVYFNPRAYLVERGLDDEGTPHTAQDDIDIAAGKVPGSFYLDGIHPTAAGQRAIARVFLEKMIELGWIDASTVTIPPRVIPLPDLEPTDPAIRGLNLKTAGSSAEYPASAPIQAAQIFSARFLIKPDSMASQVIYRRRNSDGSDNVFNIQTLSSGSLRVQVFPSGGNTGAVQQDIIMPAFVPGSQFRLRVDVDSTTRTYSAHTAVDGTDLTDAAPWTLAETKTVGAGATGMPSRTYPVSLLGPDGYVRSFLLLDGGGATLASADFTAEDGGAGWTLLGGATVTGPMA